MAEATTPPLNLGHVTDFTLDHVPNFDYLNAPDQEMRARYLSSLAEGLMKTPLHPTKQKGGYLQLYTPLGVGENTRPVAVKVFKTDETHFRAVEKRRVQRNGDYELEKLLKDSGYVLLANYSTTPSYGELSPTEKNFLQLAYEHRLHEQLYAPYVLPGLFVAYPSPEDIVDPYPVDPEDPVEKRIKEEREQPGYRYVGSQELIIGKGESVYAMVQNFENLGPSVFRMKPEDFSTEQIAQLKDFTAKVERVLKETGYFPDESMYKPVSDNLRFNDKGQLILIDTNHLLTYDDRNGSPTLFLRALKKIISG